ncbi:MAG TPA: dihydropteroate synthase [Vicinamibacterales bacterium]|nr:dihydropteroate synthase [Vicinamibacterales bacterium]
MLTRKRYRIPLPGGRTLELGERTLVMGILNVTPDSFSDGGVHLDPARAIEAGLRMAEAGADILDVGGESTRPGADPAGGDEEMRRVLPVIEGLAGRTPALISIDTYRGVVAREAAARGAAIVNDVSGLQYDAELGAAAAETGAALILMHTRGRSREMYERAVYEHVVAEVTQELADAMKRAVDAGVARDAVILDPGFGFAKRAEHSYTLLAHLDALAALDRPLLSGPSRKSFLREALGDRPPLERDWGTAAAVAASVLAGAHIVRVHNVRAMIDVVRVCDRLQSLKP